MDTQRNGDTAPALWRDEEEKDKKEKEIDSENEYDSDYDEEGRYIWG